MLTFSSVTVRRGPRVLFSGATFSLFRGEKVGVTGENGSGKSTLLSLVRGELHPDAGDFEMPAGLAVAHVSQDIDATEQQAIEWVLDGDAELRQIERDIELATERNDGLRLGSLHARYSEIGGYDAGARAARLLHGLGFSTADETRPIRAFSGGWRVRLNVAKALMCRSDLLLLDEPTNHLDIDSRAALAEAINEFPGAVIMVSHDRYLIEACADQLWLVANQTVATFDGDLDEYRRIVLSIGDTRPASRDRGNDRAKETPNAKPERARGEKRSPLRQRIAEAEAEIARINGIIAKIDTALALPDLFKRDPKQAAQLSKARAGAESALQRAEEEWLAVSSQYDEATG